MRMACHYCYLDFRLALGKRFVILVAATHRPVRLLSLGLLSRLYLLTGGKHFDERFDQLPGLFPVQNALSWAAAGIVFKWPLNYLLTADCRGDMNDAGHL